MFIPWSVIVGAAALTVIVVGALFIWILKLRGTIDEQTSTIANKDESITELDRTIDSRDEKAALLRDKIADMEAEVRRHRDEIVLTEGLIQEALKGGALQQVLNKWATSMTLEVTKRLSIKTIYLLTKLMDKGATEEARVQTLMSINSFQPFALMSNESAAAPTNGKISS